MTEKASLNIRCFFQSMLSEAFFRFFLNLLHLGGPFLRGASAPTSVSQWLLHANTGLKNKNRCYITYMTLKLLATHELNKIITSKFYQL